MKTVQTMLAEAEAEVPRISPDEAKGMLGRADVLFLDVREPAEVATSGKVPGALAARTCRVLCPFCYVGQHRTAILLRHGLDVVELPFQAHPDIPPGRIRGPSQWADACHARTRGQRSWIAMNWPPRLPNTRRALAAAEWARQHQPRAFPQFHKGLFEAHFVLGEDLEDPAVIDQHASEADIDLAALQAALAKTVPRQALRKPRRLAANMAFKVRRHGYWHDD